MGAVACDQAGTSTTASASRPGRIELSRTFKDERGALVHGNRAQAQSADEHH
jgi:hypothetical protein